MYKIKNISQFTGNYGSHKMYRIIMIHDICPPSIMPCNFPESRSPNLALVGLLRRVNASPCFTCPIFVPLTVVLRCSYFTVRSVRKIVLFRSFFCLLSVSFYFKCCYCSIWKKIRKLYAFKYVISC